MFIGEQPGDQEDRAPDEQTRRLEMERFIQDLKKIAEVV